jgi:hypothetical protein
MNPNSLMECRITRLSSLLYLKSFDSIVEYTQVKIVQIKGSVDIIVNLIRNAFPEAIGLPGEPGDVDHIFYVANRLLSVYDSITTWALDFCNIMTDEEFKGLIHSFVHICESKLDDFERFSRDVTHEVQKIPDVINTGAQPLIVNISFVFSKINDDEFRDEMDKLARKYHLPRSDVWDE